MKKLMLLLVCILSVQLGAMADNDRPIPANELPSKIQQFIKAHFGDTDIALAKEEKNFSGSTYEVIFTNGNKVEFDRSGEWEEINCKYTFVPTALIPATMMEFIKKNYPDMKVVEMEKKRNTYEIKLGNGLELIFDSQGNFKKYD